MVWLAGLLYGLAETSRHGVDAPMSGRVFVFLGAASYALYMIHLPIDIVWFHALEKFGVTETSDLTAARWRDGWRVCCVHRGVDGGVSPDRGAGAEVHPQTRI